MELTINGATRQVDAEADTPLPWVIRDELGLTGAKYGCGAAQRGDCTVLVDGQPTRSCVTPVESVAGRSVTTIEAVEQDPTGRRVVAAWVAIDPGRIVNSAIIETQVNSAVALGISSALLEEVVYEGRVPRVHARIVESGAPMGGIGEPGLPGVPPAVANAVAAPTGQRIRSLPLSKTRFGAA